MFPALGGIMVADWGSRFFSDMTFLVRSVQEWHVLRS